MIRKLETLGFATMAILAFGAVAVSGALAQNHLVESNELTLTGVETGTGLNRLTAFGARVECPGSTYTGPVSGSTVTITPIYVNCKATALGFPATVDMNGCDYALHLGVTTATNTYSVQSTLSCPGTGPQVTIFKMGATEHNLATELKCTVEIDPEEGGYSGLHLTDTTNGHVDLTGEATSLLLTQHPGPVGGCLSGATEDPNGKIDVDITFDADADVGVAVEET